jgi:predicted Zn-dependent protease
MPTKTNSRSDGLNRGRFDEGLCYEGLSRRQWLRGLALTAAGGTLLNAEEPHVVVPSFNTLTDAEEIALGRKFSAELERELPILDVGPLSSYVNSIVEDLGKQSQRPRLRFAAKVANTADVNAVSLPGGFIYVFRGLLETAQSEAELASVLAHEIGHVAAHHSANKLMLDFRARQVYELVRKNLELENSVIAQVIERLGGPLVVLAQLKYGRELEFEADLLGCYEMARAGWDPRGMVGMFQRLQSKRRGGGDWIDDILSTHPNSGERIERIRGEISSMRLRPDLRSNSLSFQAMKVGLNLLPDPVMPKR